nr:hypothetical protein [Oceanococcus sp. HetDA_MAG_MS8]
MPLRKTSSANWMLKNPSRGLLRRIFGLGIMGGACSVLSGAALAADLAPLIDGRLDAAIRSFEQRLAANPFDPVLLNNLAVSEAQAANYSGARTLLRRAAKLAPKNIVIADNLEQINQFLDLRTQQAESPEAAASQTQAPEVLPAPPALWMSPRMSPRMSEEQ